jgi:glycosyltransferase involved in cell wall biosynthesis
VTLRIACIHQGYELYGSDRSFAESVAALRLAYPSAEIEVVLPRDGPIRGLLEANASRIVIEPLWVLRRRDLPRLVATAPVVLPLAVLRAARRLRRCDLVYINTSVIVDHVLAARFFPGKALQHIHEIPEGATRTLLRRLVLWGRARLIFNSRATRDAFDAPPDHPSDVIYNGVAGPADWAPTDYDGKRSLRVLMLGRINRIKGQEVLLAALAALPPDIRDRIETRIVGSAFEDPGLETALREAVTGAGLASHVSVEPFLDDPTPLYRWADVVTVPSRRPESLGGLREVVADGVTGRLLPPGDADTLAQALAGIVGNPGMLAPMARAGRERFAALFSEQAVAQAIAAVAGDMLRQRPARPR